MKNKTKFKVWDCLGSCWVTSQIFKSKYHAEKRRMKEVQNRNLTPDCIVVFEA